MHVLVISQYFWPEDFRINDVVRGLAGRGHQVTVLTGRPNYPGGKLFPGYGQFNRRVEEYEGARILRVPLTTRGQNSGLRLALNYLSFAASASLFGPFLCTGKYDAILVFEPSPVTIGIPARILASLKRLPMLFWVQDLWPESLEATGAVKSLLILGLVKRLVSWIYRGCDRILVQSEAFVEPVKQFDVPPGKIGYLPNSAEAVYKPAEKSDLPAGATLPEGFCIMFAGNIGAAQSFETILSAAELLRDHKSIHWVILGDGRQAEWVREEVTRRKLANCFHLMGRFPVDSMPAWFAHADAMLVTLKRSPIFALTIPSKVQSYLACAKPVVAAIDGEGARIVDISGAGLSAPAEDAQALADAVLSLYKMPDEERVAMGRNGLAYFKDNFARDLLLDRLEHWLLESGRMKK